MTDEGTVERVSEGMLGIVALELALTSARWVVANRDGAAEQLPGTLGDQRAQLLAMWHTIAVRRDALVHPAGWPAFRNMAADIVVGPRSVNIKGFPPLGFDTWRMWTVVLREWSQRLADDPIADDGRPVEEQAPLRRALYSFAHGSGTGRSAEVVGRRCSGEKPRSAGQAGRVDPRDRPTRTGRGNERLAVGA
jgi:hypothetical protein